MVRKILRHKLTLFFFLFTFLFKETQHHVFLVMEYCNGGDLADYLSGMMTRTTLRYH